MATRPVGYYFVYHPGKFPGDGIGMGYWRGDDWDFFSTGEESRALK